MVIEGSIIKQLLSNGYSDVEPSEILVNGIKKDSCREVCKLKDPINNITLKFEKALVTCYSMFNNLRDIIEIDMSNFDATMVKSMGYMFFSMYKFRKNKFWKYKH